MSIRILTVGCVALTLTGCKVATQAVVVEPSPEPSLEPATAVVTTVASPLPSPTPSTQPSLPQPSPTPTLIQSITCTDGGNFVENQNVSYDYAVLYTLKTLSDASQTVTCHFSSLHVNSVGTALVPLNPEKDGSDTGFIHGLTCDVNLPYTYTFNVEAYPAEGWAAKSLNETVSLPNCLTTNY